jgi:hypothetical protein
MGVGVFYYSQKAAGLLYYDFGSGKGLLLIKKGGD